MVCRSEVAWALVGLVILATCSGCRLHVQMISDGTAWAADDYEAIDAGAELSEVLARLGPPDRVTHTLDHEILEYRRAAHRGSDLTFLLPTRANPVSGVVNTVRAISNFFFPDFRERGEFDNKNRAENFAGSLIDLLFSFTPLSFSAEDSVTLHNRRLRFDVMQFEFGRTDHRVVGKSLFFGVDIGRSEKLLGSTLLLDE